MKISLLYIFFASYGMAFGIAFHRNTTKQTKLQPCFCTGHKTFGRQRQPDRQSWQPDRQSWESKEKIRILPAQGTYANLLFCLTLHEASTNCQHKFILAQIDTIKNKEQEKKTLNSKGS